MNIGEDRNQDRFKKWQLCGVWKLPFCNHRAIKLRQNCVCSANPSINLPVPPSVIRENHHKTLELIDLLQFIAAYLQLALALVSVETQYPMVLSSAHLHSRLVARSCKPTKCILKPLLRNKQYQSSAKSKRLILQLSNGDAALIDIQLTLCQ